MAGLYVKLARFRLPNNRKLLIIVLKVIWHLFFAYWNEIGKPSEIKLLLATRAFQSKYLLRNISASM